MTDTGRQEKPHPIQPLVKDEHGVVRFKENAIVRYLLDAGGSDMNKLAVMPFSREDREQFAQLIGYSHSGAFNLSYMSAEVLDAAERMDHEGVTELEARNAHLRETIDSVKAKLRAGIGELYDVGSDFDEI